MAKFRMAAGKVVRALDPVKGEMVSSLDLKRATREEAKEYIRMYNSTERAGGAARSGNQAGEAADTFHQRAMRFGSVCEEGKQHCQRLG